MIIVGINTKEVGKSCLLGIWYLKFENFQNDLLGFGMVIMSFVLLALFIFARIYDQLSALTR